MELPINIPKPPRKYGEKSEEKPSKIALLTPAQKALLNGTANPVILDLIKRFGLDVNAHSSIEALDTIKINHRVDTIFAQLAGTPPPTPPDLSKYAPLSPGSQKILHDRQRQRKLNSLPPGLTINDKGNITFDLQWKQKAIHPTELPHDHPDWTPF